MKKINIIDLWRNLTALFKLTEHTPAEFLFQETLTPVIDVLDLVGSQDSIAGSLVVSGAGDNVLITVPDDELWFISRGFHEITGTPNCTMQTALYPLGAVGDALYIVDDLVTTGTALREQIYFDLPLILEPTDTIHTIVAPYVAGGNYTLRFRGKKLIMK